MLNVISKTFDIGDGREVTIETGHIARQAHGAVIVRMGKAALMATVVSAYEPKPGMGFFPLFVDYQEKFASAGRIPGGFLKRESRLSTYEILICRLVDRALRPLFPDGYLNETQIAITLISYDEDVMPDTLAALAASAALIVSDIPFDGPISEVRVARIDGEFCLNPKEEELENADLDIMLAATEDNIMMVEGEMKEVDEEDLIEAIQFGHEVIKFHCQMQKELEELVGSQEKREVEAPAEDEDLKKAVEEAVSDKVYEVAKGALSKKERKEALGAIKEELLEPYKAQLEAEEIEEGVIDLVKKYFSKTEKEVIRNMMLKDRTRLDGRDLDEVRELAMTVDFVPSPHGSAIFTRGETQALSTVTLGTKKEEQMIDKASGLEFDQFMLHYNFPAFSTGEIKPNRGPSRREIGHGTLAKRSLEGMLPSQDDCPYVIRVVADILESNGSSSMATVCSGSLALFDAGVKMKSAVSGIAMGLITNEEGDYAVLSDILGDEDHLGDMDFKVTGTKNGICACQMDIKIDGLPYEVLKDALEQSKRGRLHILEQMLEVMPEPREDYKSHAPRIEKLFIPKEFIGAIIGPGGKHIQELQRNTDTIIMIEEVDERGVVTISSKDLTGIEAASGHIKAMTMTPEVNEVYDAIVKSIMPYGAFVEFMPGKEGLLHVSEMAWERVNEVEDLFKVGDSLQVKLLDIDQRSGKYRLSRKVLLEKPEGYVERESRGGDRRGGGGHRGNGRDRDRRGGNDRRNRRD